MTTDVIAGKYKIVREIARSNDVVYEAIDTTMGRRVAVKELILPPNLIGVSKQERIDRFNREARAAGKLVHPNIVTIYESGQFDGRYFIAMEYLEGGTLRDAIQSRGALPLQEAMEVTAQILSGLSHAHSRQVIHRDVKPDNIHMLPGGVVKLTDFGIARLTEEASLTGEGQVFGTPSYMSPEQIEGRFIDHRSDLFSMAVVLYEMVAGRKPFTGDSVVSITYSIMHNDPAPLVGVPIGVEQVIFRALAKDPGRRFGSAEEMRVALKNADSVPAMFLPRQPTYMGGAMGQPGGFPQTYGQPTGFPPTAYPQHVPTAGPTAWAPPPQPAPPQPQTAGGPFVNWGSGQPAGAPPPPYAAPPPMIPRRTGPIISEGARQLIAVFLIAVVLSSIVVGAVLLFLRAYETQQKRAPELAAQKLLGEAIDLQNKGNLDAAIPKYEEAINKAPTSDIAATARKDMAVAYNFKGIYAYEHGDMKSAEKFWNQATDIDPDNQDVHKNLSKLYERSGDPERAKDEMQKSLESGKAGGSNPGAPGDNTVLSTRIQKAKQYLDDGIQLYNNSDTQAAREKWSLAVGEAPGTDVARQAQDYLDKTATGPSF